MVTEAGGGGPEEAVYQPATGCPPTGTGIFLAAVLSAFWLRRRAGPLPCTFFVATCLRMRWPLFTIACMLAIAFTTRYSGMDATLGLAFTHTGCLYPFFAALLGWLGVALTGSDTSSNALFGSLQTITAGNWCRAACFRSTYTRPCAARHRQQHRRRHGQDDRRPEHRRRRGRHASAGQEGPILRFVFWHSLLLAMLMGCLVLFQAYVWTDAIP